MALYPLVRPLAFALDPERAHRLTIRALKMLRPGLPPEREEMLTVRLPFLEFSNPVGLAAGFDKDAEVWRQMLGFGFSFVEVGTLTPRPQAGNPRPRLFRLHEDRAIINRMGFNNGGIEAARARIDRGRSALAQLEFKLSGRWPGHLGFNIGANKDSTDRIADYVACVRAMPPQASYLTVNISSPNTPGLRALQDKSALDDLLAAVMEVRGQKPVFLKLAPDLEREDIDDIAAVVIDRKVDALIVSNTTITRPPLKSRYRDETGGLSGAPLSPLALERLRDFRKATGGAMPLVAAGGIASGADAYERIRAGASLVQLYSALVYEGPGLASRIVRDLKALLTRDGFGSVCEAVGTQ